MHRFALHIRCRYGFAEATLIVSIRRPDTPNVVVHADRHELEKNRVVFATPTGRRLEYGRLAAFDAEGTSVEARFEVPSEDRLRIVLVAENAIYPLTVDPLLTATADTQLYTAKTRAGVEDVAEAQSLEALVRNATVDSLASVAGACPLATRHVL